MDKHMLNHGKSGAVHLRMSWVYDETMDAASPSFNPTTNLPPPLSALEQLQENSAETTLKLGNLANVSNMLDNFPLYLDVKRVTIRRVDFFLADLFRGYHGAFELGSKAQVMQLRKMKAAAWRCCRPCPPSPSLQPLLRRGQANSTALRGPPLGNGQGLRCRRVSVCWERECGCPA